MSKARDEILAAGVAIVRRRGLFPGVGHVRVTEAARAAGFTSGAAYRYWPTQESFHRDLAEATLRSRDRSSYADVIASIRGPVDAGAPFLEVVRQGAAAFAARGPEQSDAFVTMALRAGAFGEPELSRAAADRVAEGILEHAQVWDVLMAMAGRRMRVPFDREHLAQAIAAIADGFMIQDVGRRHPHLERPDLGDGIGADWSLLGVVVQAVVEFFTEPIERDEAGGPVGSSGSLDAPPSGGIT